MPLSQTWRKTGLLYPKQCKPFCGVKDIQIPYEALKQLTRTNKTISKPELHAFIDGLSLPDQVKNELKAISPFNYTGI